MELARFVKLALIIPLSLSAFSHLWNPIGFPDLFYDEGVYLRRAMHVIAGFGPQEAYFYDHPHFGQMFLAGMLAIIGYPASFNPSESIESMERLYLAPRILLGILAVVDTFLVFKISQKRYNTKIALIASILFAVMPITWLLRRILLDSILLPFLLGSILLSLYCKDSKHAGLVAITSGILLGLAIYTKIPAFVMMPLVGYFVYTNSDGSKMKCIKLVAQWIAPVILIPLLWPIQSIIAGQFDSWTRDVLWQTQRDSGGILSLLYFFFEFDPVLMILGLTGLGYIIFRRDIFLALWTIPFIVFLSVIGYVQYFHWIPILPALTIASARMISELPNKINNIAFRRSAPFLATAAIAAFGLVSTTMIITTNVTSAQFETLSFAANYLSADNNDSRLTTLASPVYTWILNYVLQHNHVFKDYRDALFYPIQTDGILLLADGHLQYELEDGERLGEIYEETIAIKVFEGGVTEYDSSKYPYTNMHVNLEGSRIEVRVK